jgi:ribosome-binding protein aMBF1 (putative translation factor)
MMEPRKARVAGDAVAHARAIVEADPAIKAEYERLGPRWEAATAIIAARYARGLSQRDLARLMGVSQPVVARLESAEHSPRIDSLAAAARAMGLRIRIMLEPLEAAYPLDVAPTERRVAEEPGTYEV